MSGSTVPRRDASRDVTIADGPNGHQPVRAHVTLAGSPDPFAMLMFDRPWSSFHLSMSTGELVALRDAITEVIDAGGLA